MTEPAQGVLASVFSHDSSVVWEVSVWIDDPWRMRSLKSALLESIWWALKEGGITIAFPQVDVHVDREVIAAIRRRGTT